MGFIDLRSFIEVLAREGELQRTGVEVDPNLEVTEIARRSILEEKKALLFEKVKGSPFPLLVNAYASSKRLEIGLRMHPGELGNKLVKFMEEVIPPRPSVIWRNRSFVRRLFSARLKRQYCAKVKQVQELPKLSSLPLIKSWPEDGGKFITLGQVFTQDPLTSRRNIGIYRMQVFDDSTTGMHWQIQKGGGFHHRVAQKMDLPLKVAVVIGSDPTLLIASIAALPEGIDELMFSGFLRGQPTKVTKTTLYNLTVPAYAEFVLEGFVNSYESRMEGPFGDHFGHYSLAAEFPVFHIQRVYRRRKAIYVATVVGKPPMEDRFLGDATQEILGPLIRIMHPEIKGLWAYHEAGFHNLLAVSIEERYPKEGLKTAVSMLGEGQLSLSKCVVVVDSLVNPRSFTGILAAIRKHFDSKRGFILIPHVPLDTLDFTSFRMNIGSKIVIDATSPFRQSQRPIASSDEFKAPFSLKLKDIFPGVLDYAVFEDTLIVVQVRSQARELLRKMLRHYLLLDEVNIKIIAVVSEDIDLTDETSVIWGIFTRFDASLDVEFTSQYLQGSVPCYSGIMGIDATLKEGYPAPLKMDGDVERRVDDLWGQIWNS